MQQNVNHILMFPVKINVWCLLCRLFSGEFCLWTSGAFGLWFVTYFRNKRWRRFFGFSTHYQLIKHVARVINFYNL